MRAIAPGAASCPGCDQIDGVEQNSSMPLVTAWRCVRCELSWAVSVVNPKARPGYLADLGAAAEEIGRLRWVLNQIITLADASPALTDARLRERLLALADRVRPPTDDHHHADKE